MADPNELCRVCGEPRSAHVATAAGELTHPREARGEGKYRLVASGTIGAYWPGDDDLPWERYEFVPSGAKP